MNDTQLPSRWLVARALAAAAASGGAVFGSAEAARIILAERLMLADSDVLLLLLVGGVGGAVVGAVGAAPLLALPRRPLGRARWLGFVGGVLATTLARFGVAWFTDPPPFTEGWPLQGNMFVFGASGVLMLVAFAVLYQAARGARAALGTALAVAIALATWALQGGAPLTAASKPLPQGAPNVLLVTLDTTRADRLGAYGNASIRTRAFDALAEDGALFTSASAVAPVTGPSHASMFLGAGPWDHGVLLNGVPMPTDRPVLAEVLHDHGWTTAGFVSAYVLDGVNGFSRGFGVYDDTFSWIPGSEMLVLPRMSAMAARHADPDEVLERRGADTVDRALSWLAQHGDRPWFVWVHLFDAHGPYDPPPPYDTLYYQGDPQDPSVATMDRAQNIAPYLKKSLEGVTDLSWVFAQYDGEVSYADAQLGRLLSAVDEQKTLVAVIGDHGESLGEHGVWFNHGDDVYETSVHVPFALRWPGHVPVSRVTSPFEGSDLAPTLLELVGVARPETMTGTSAVPALGGAGGRAVAHAMCFDRPANQEARARGEIVGPKYRTVGLRGPASRYVTREVDASSSYFALGEDPLGVVDVAAAMRATPEGVELLGILDGQARALLAGDATERSAVEVSDEERARLEALGYMSP